MGRGGAVEKPQDFGKVMGKLVRFCRKYVPAIIIALVLGAAGTICQIIGPDKRRHSVLRMQLRSLSISD